MIRRGLRQQQQAVTKRVKVGIALAVAAIFLGPLLLRLVVRWWGGH